MEEFPRYAGGMRSRGEEEALRAENEQLRELLAQALARIEALEAKV